MSFYDTFAFMKRLTSDDETFQIPLNQQECFVLCLCSSLCVQYLLVMVEGAAGLNTPPPGFMDMVFQVYQSLCGLSAGFSVLQLSSLSTPEPASWDCCKTPETQRQKWISKVNEPTPTLLLSPSSHTLVSSLFNALYQFIDQGQCTLIHTDI